MMLVQKLNKFFVLWNYKNILNTHHLVLNIYKFGNNQKSEENEFMLYEMGASFYHGFPFLQSIIKLR